MDTVAIVGIGRVGLPLALVLAEVGCIVYGIDNSQPRVDVVKKGRMPFMEEGAPPLLKKHVNKHFFPTTDFGHIRKAKTIILTLGTPIDENMNPVLDQINQAVDAIIPYLKTNQLIILRSTVSPKTTDYIQEKIELETKFRVGKDVFLAFCPERIAEGKAIVELKQLPQIIGGNDANSTQYAKRLFRKIGVNCIVTDSISAELAKLFTNMYRYISFAIANEFFVIAESYQRNSHQIINIVNSGYKRGGLALPGLTAGPCLFKDGFFLINESPFLDLIVASWKINESIPLLLVQKIKEKTPLINVKVVILGMSFKPEVDDIRESLSFKLRKALLREHAKIVLHDPYVKDYKKQPIENNMRKALKGAEVMILATKHKIYINKRVDILNSISDDTIICDIWQVFDTQKLIFTAREAKTSYKKSNKRKS